MPLLNTETPPPRRPLVEAADAPPTRTVLVQKVVELAQIFESDCNTAVLERVADARVLDEARAFLEQNPRGELKRVTLPEAIALDKDLATVPPALRGDIGVWVELLATITGAGRVGVRLVCLSSAMCPRFHADKVTLRLVTTYVGLGTELFGGVHLELRPGRAAERAGPPSAQISRATPGDIVLLKGDAWPGNHGRGAVHRSPAASPDNPRLVLTVDALEA